MFSKIQELQSLSNVGFEASHPDLICYPHQIYVARDWNRETAGTVALISGGGDGHFPLHQGYVGKGMLTAVVMGSIFASPPTLAIVKAIEYVSVPNDPKSHGTLLIVKNYMGDVLHFAAALQIATTNGYKVDMVVVRDDISLPIQKRRGIAGTVMVHKLLGSYADSGATLAELVSFFKTHIEPNLATIGWCWKSCVLQGYNGIHEKQHSVGIHGETGITIEDSILNTSTTMFVKSMYDKIIKALTPVSIQEEVIILVNNLGTATELDLLAIMGILLSECNGTYSFPQIRRILAGTACTGYNTGGISITVLKVRRPWRDETKSVDSPNLIDLLEKSTSCPFWNRLHSTTLQIIQSLPNQSLTSALGFNKDIDNATTRAIHQNMDEFYQWMKQFESVLNEIDKETGDGDCGTTVVNTLYLLRTHFQRSWKEWKSSTFWVELGECLSLHMGGTFGGFLSLFATIVGRTLQQTDSSRNIYRILCKSAYELIQTTQSQLGSRTFLDVLVPTFEYLSIDQIMDGKDIMSYIQKLCLSTMFMCPTVGRASYFHEGQTSFRFPDAGAKAIELSFQFLMECAK